MQEDRERLLGLAALSFLSHENLRDANALVDVRTFVVLLSYGCVCLFWKGVAN